MDTKDAGRRGGMRRAARMTPEERSEAAKKAARARWSMAKNHELPAPPVAVVATQQELIRLIRESHLNISRLEIAIFESRQAVTRTNRLVELSKNLRAEARTRSEFSDIGREI